MTTDCTAWWAVMIEGEYPELVGPFRVKEIADKAAADWNDNQISSDRAYVLPLLQSIKDVSLF